ncbi:DUF4383 domain-containing protein [Naasia sp. SYSU D00057]|uniref:DUF4383 domain-containing protein n=1 Tax=Naasia sp. SYSU D00057 TaxID=2817380 RepID=UPI001B312C9B|nr:DUF4383 domain-containing protein [Naasia sp. SYSU D00057]
MSTASGSARAPLTRSPNRLVATIFGAVYTLVGLVGFFVTGGVDFAGTEGASLLGFEVNPLHNIVHLLIGIALLIGGLSSVSAAKSVNGIVGAVYLLVGILGFFIENTGANILALNTADHFLHLVSAVVLLGVAIGADKSAARARVA